MSKNAPLNHKKSISFLLQVHDLQCLVIFPGLCKILGFHLCHILLKTLRWRELLEVFLCNINIASYILLLITIILQQNQHTATPEVLHPKFKLPLLFKLGIYGFPFWIMITFKVCSYKQVMVRGRKEINRQTHSSYCIKDIIPSYPYFSHRRWRYSQDKVN